MKNKNEVLEGRREAYLADAAKNGLTKDQKHLDDGTPERDYWHYGYGRRS